MIFRQRPGRHVVYAVALILLATCAVVVKSRYFPREIRDPQIPSAGLGGVTYWNKEKSFDGVNLVIPYNRRQALGCDVMDMKGKLLLHLPSNFCGFSTSGIATIYEGTRDRYYLRWLKPDFKIAWQHTSDSVHHDLFINESRGEIFVPVEQPRETYKKYLLENGGCVFPDKNIFQGIHGYDLNGKKIFQWRSTDHLDELMTLNEELGFDCHQRYASISKINGVFVIDRPLRSGDDRIFIPGNLLVSLDLCACLVVLDRGTGNILWSYKPAPGYHSHIHNVSLTREGEVMFFQNNFSEPYQDPGDLFSDVFIIDPYSKKVTWHYRAKRNGAFFTGWGGSAQQLPNGNILVTHKGAAFEITRKKEIVWEWINPLRAPDGQPDDVYRVTRMPHSTWDLYK